MSPSEFKDRLRAASSAKRAALRTPSECEQHNDVIAVWNSIAPRGAGMCYVNAAGELVTDRKRAA